MKINGNNLVEYNPQYSGQDSNLRLDRTMPPTLPTELPEILLIYNGVIGALPLILHTNFAVYKDSVEAHFTYRLLFYDMHVTQFRFLLLGLIGRSHTEP